MQVVNEYLSGSLSQYELIGKYHLRSRHQVQNWVRAYNSSGDLKSRDSGGGSYMKKAQTITPVERLKIVQDCLDNKKNYGAAALKYQCFYQQVRNWVKHYE